MVLHSHFSQFLLFSEYPIMSPNFLNHCIIHQILVEHVDNQKTFPCCLSEEQNRHENAAKQRIQKNVGTKNCLVFSVVVFREVGDIVVRIVDERRVITEVFLSNFLGS